jgi:hypothetical protein
MRLITWPFGVTLKKQSNKGKSPVLPPIKQAGKIFFLSFFSQTGGVWNLWDSSYIKEFLISYRINYRIYELQVQFHKTSQKNTHSKIELIMKQVHKFQNYTTWPRHHMFFMWKNSLFSGLIDQVLVKTMQVKFCCFLELIPNNWPLTLYTVLH